MSAAESLIVVVEDSEDVREFLDFLLSTDGHRVVACANADEGFDAIRRERPELVVTDLMLGATSGLDLISRIKSDLAPPVPPVIACSGFNDFAGEAIKRGAALFVPKPFDGATIRDAVRSVLGREPHTGVADDVQRRARTLREEAATAAQAVLTRLSAERAEVARRGEATAAWLPSYFGFGDAFLAMLAGPELRVHASNDEVRWPRHHLINNSVCRDMLETASSLMVSDLTRLGTAVTSADGGPVRFFTGVPLLYGPTAVGVLCLVDRQPQVLDPESFALLSALARRVSAVLTGRDSESEAIWTNSGLLTRHGLELLLECELGRAARTRLLVSLLVCTDKPVLPRPDARTAVAELAADRYALLVSRPDEPGCRDEMEHLVHFARDARAAGLMSIDGDIVPSAPGVVRAGEMLLDRALRSPEPVIECLELRRDTLRPSP